MKTRTTISLFALLMAATLPATGLAQRNVNRNPNRGGVRNDYQGGNHRGGGVTGPIRIGSATYYLGRGGGRAFYAPPVYYYGSPYSPYRSYAYSPSTFGGFPPFGYGYYRPF